MARRFMYVALAILTLALAYNVGADRAGADFDPSVQSTIVGSAGTSVLASNGEVWWFNFGIWERQPEFDPPVPLSEIKFWQKSAIITHDDDAWGYNVGTPGWTHVGPFPGGPVPVESDSFGAIKGRFR